MNAPASNLNLPRGQIIRQTAIFTLAVVAASVLTRAPAAEGSSTFVDAEGVMRFTESRAAVAHFGVNYSTPFAHAFRAHQRLGIPVEQAIDADVYHFARLGFDAYRIHIWDREITDAEGNLLVNEHVQAFDYLLAKLKQRGIKIILTPLQFGNAGYPEPGVPLPGFSSKYGKRGSLEDHTSWPLQERYLQQLMEHVNPHTGVAYKVDPDILAVEINNEPGHFEYEATISYINTMARAIRATGCAKPILYNMSHGLPVYQAYLDAEVQGGTFQWYPANLVAGHEQRGNFLPYVDKYPIPFANAEKFKRIAKVVYEFDAADIGRSYIYPAIARTFRTAGFQFATQFAYDPMYLAPFNTEYQTHYVNLAYAPQKALGMKIAGEAFRRVPLHRDYGAYPANTKFEGVTVSYHQDLAELVTEREFYHSNATDTKPPSPEKLEHIAGYQNSPLITYPGQGAYFLDRLEPGVWRLEVMPDAIWVRDPFEKPHPEKHVVRIAWNQWPIEIRLPDLGPDFSVKGLNDGNDLQQQARGGNLTLGPGAYLLTRGQTASRWSRDSTWRNIALKEFVAPKSSLDRTYVLHTPAVEASAGADLVVTATVATADPSAQVELIAYPPKERRPPEPPPVAEGMGQPGRFNAPGVGIVTDDSLKIPMRRNSGFQFSASIPGAQLHPGTLRYHLVVKTSDHATTYPAEIAGLPSDWSFYGKPWTVRVVDATAPLLLFEAVADSNQVTADNRDVAYALVPSDRPGISAMSVVATELEKREHDHSFRFFFKNKIAARRSRLPSSKQIVLYGNSATARPCPLQVSLVTADGNTYGGIVNVAPKFDAYSVPIAELKQVRSPNIPHGYPSFIPFWTAPQASTPLDLSQVESVLVSIGPGIPAADYKAVHGVNVERIWLE